MATTALSTLLPEFAKTIGAYAGSYTTTTVPGADTSVISTNLRNRGYVEDDMLEDFYLWIEKDSSNNSIARHIASYTASTGTIVLSQALASAESKNITFHLFDRDPQELVDALNLARHAVYPRLHRVVIDRSLFGGYAQSRWTVPSAVKSITSIAHEPRISAKTFDQNILKSLDCDFEGDLSDWTATNLTLTARTIPSGATHYYGILAGNQSGEWVVGPSVNGRLYIEPSSTVDYEAMELNVSIWVYSTDFAATVKAAVWHGGATQATSAAHSNSGWERLTVSYKPDGRTFFADTGSTLGFGLEITGWAFIYSVKGYADELIVTAGPSEEPRLPRHHLWDWRQHGDVFEINEPVNPASQLVIEGTGVLSEVDIATPTGTMELGEDGYDVLFAAAAEALYQSEMDGVDGNELNANQRIQTHFRNKQAAQEGSLPALLRTNH